MCSSRRRHGWTTATLLAGVAVFCCHTPAAAEESAHWDVPISTGYDVYVHDYFLADTDTTEVIQEFNLAAALRGSSAFGADTRWRLHAGASAGTELFRQSLDAGIRLRKAEGNDWFRADLLWLAREFRSGSEYDLSSDNQEGQLSTRLSPFAGQHAVLEFRGRGRYVDFQRPSELELDYVDGNGGLYLRSPTGSMSPWSLGGRLTSRSYADSTEINRSGYLFEGDATVGDFNREFRIFHRTERREIEDPTVRPSAWLHWSEIEGNQPLPRGEIVGRGTLEIWDYDTNFGAWYDSWAIDGEGGYRWGDPLRARWELTLTGRKLSAGDQPESHTQAGLRFGAETNGTRFSGLASVEVGRRWYRDLPQTVDLIALEYSDYTYTALWLMANWAITPSLSVDLTANFLPESHTLQEDNVALGFGSLRLVWRP